MWGTISDYMNSFLAALVALLSIIFIPEIKSNRKYLIGSIILMVIFTVLGLDKTRRDNQEHQETKALQNELKVRSDSTIIYLQALKDSLKNIKVPDEKQKVINTYIDKVNTLNQY